VIWISVVITVFSRRKQKTKKKKSHQRACTLEGKNRLESFSLKMTFFKISSTNCWVAPLAVCFTAFWDSGEPRGGERGEKQMDIRRELAKMWICGQELQELREVCSSPKRLELGCTADFERRKRYHHASFSWLAL